MKHANRLPFIRAKKDEGFTFIEFLLVISIMAITAAAALTMFRDTNKRALTQDAQASVLYALERARSRAVNGFGETDHGVYVKTNSVVAFEGDTYVPGEGREIPLPFPVSTDHSGTAIVFSRLSGQSTASTTITVSHPSGIEYPVNVTHEGTIWTQ